MAVDVVASVLHIQNFLKQQSNLLKSPERHQRLDG